MKKPEANMEKYKAHLKARGYDKLIPMDNPPSDLNQLMNRLAAEGRELLEKEKLTGLKKLVPEKPTPAKVLESALGLIDKNPYVRARAQVLKDLPADKRKAIEEMERTGNTENTRYSEFLKMVRVLGDRFSDRT